MPYLMSEMSDGKGQRFQLDDGETTLGRHPDCGVVIEDAAVSRNHARIVSKGGKYLLEDLESRNGTYLNRRLIQQPTRLLNGDQIRVCDHLFTFYLDESLNDSRGIRTMENAVRHEPQSKSLESSILFDDQGSDLSGIMSQVDVDSHHSGSTMLGVKPEVRLKALINITQALGSAIALDKVLPRVLDSLFDLFHQADRGFVVMAEPDGQLRPLAMKLRKEDDQATFRISRTIVRHVMDSKSAIISTDAANDNRFDLSQSIADFRIRSMMCAPLLGGDGIPFGIIQLDTPSSSAGFTSEDLDILMTVALQASAAIDRAKLHEIELRQQNLARDMELANEVQHRLLPGAPPQLSGYRFFDYYRPAEQVGGDYFDYIELPDGRVAILVGDVVGHGIAAALLMAKVSAEARFALASQRNVAEAMSKLNRAICRLQLERFITIVLMVLDPSTHEIEVVNAGHLPPIHKKDGTEATAFDTNLSGLAVGILDDFDYGCYSVKLDPGDLIVAYTDGISEAADTQGKLFGNDQVLRLACEKNWEHGTDYGTELNKLLRQHMAGAVQEDDICLVCLSRDR